MSRLTGAAGFVLPCMLALASAAFGADQSTPEKRLETSTDVIREMTGPNGIPANVLARAQCIGVIPKMTKGGFIVGARYGAGYASCRTSSGWSAPAPIQVEGGSVGLQAGAESTDLIFALMNQNAKSQLLSNSLKFGATASATAGPVGKSAETTEADALVWTRSNGVFAGATVRGAKLEADNGTMHQLYGKNVTERQILEGQVRPPAQSEPFINTLDQVTSE